MLIKQTLVSLFMAASLSDAQEAMQALDYKRAVTLYREYISQNGNQEYEARYGLARALAFAGDYEEALKIYTAILTDFPGDPDSLLGRGRVYGWLKRFDLAAADLLLLLEKKPDYSEGWSALADTYRWDRQFEKAEQHVIAWRSKFPQAPEAALAQAVLYRDFRRFAQARSAVAEAQKLGASKSETDTLLSQIQRMPGALPWELQGFYELQAFAPSRAPWHSLTLGVKHEFPQGSLALQSLTVNRFERFDQAFVLDGYLGLWPRAAGNLRLQASVNADVLPRLDALGEVFQEFGDIWEGSLGYRYMGFTTGPVNFFQAGIGTYLGNWYLRLQPQLFLSGEGPGIQAALWARYFFDSADNFAELRVGAGRQVMLVGSNAQLQGQNIFFGLLNGQYFVTPQWGLLGTINYNYFDQYPSMFGFTVGSKFRW
jgi:YaiO family outer membrane protein